MDIEINHSFFALTQLIRVPYGNAFLQATHDPRVLHLLESTVVDGLRCRSIIRRVQYSQDMRANVHNLK